MLCLNSYIHQSTRANTHRNATKKDDCGGLMVNLGGSVKMFA